MSSFEETGARTGSGIGVLFVITSSNGFPRRKGKTSLELGKNDVNTDFLRTSLTGVEGQVEEEIGEKDIVEEVGKEVEEEVEEEVGEAKGAAVNKAFGDENTVCRSFLIALVKSCRRVRGDDDSTLPPHLIATPGSNIFAVVFIDIVNPNMSPQICISAQCALLSFHCHTVTFAYVLYYASVI